MACFRDTKKLRFNLCGSNLAHYDISEVTTTEERIKIYLQ
nr:MAG TPA: hypothetical protein [Bacteriophage sp.]